MDRKQEIETRERLARLWLEAEPAEEFQHDAPLAVQIRKPETSPSPLIGRRLSEVDLTDIGTAHAA